MIGEVKTNSRENGKIIKNAFSDAFDIVVRECEGKGKSFVLINCDGLTNSENIAESVVKPILQYEGRYPKENVLAFLEKKILFMTEVGYGYSLDEAVTDILRGNLVVFAEGEREYLSVGVQKIPERSLSEPDTEVEEHGSREGFVENIKTNLTLIRKRLCTADFTVETREVGEVGKTRLCLCYLKSKVSDEMLEEVRSRLEDVKLELLLDVSYLQPFLDTKRKTLFSCVSLTERPDVVCAKINEGKIALIADGTPYALVLPILFIENFHTPNDYMNRPYYAFFYAGDSHNIFFDCHAFAGGLCGGWAFSSRDYPRRYAL